MPEDLENDVWEYNYTQVSDNSEQSTTITIGTATLQNSIRLSVFGTIIDDWTCVNDLPISNTEKVVVFKSDVSYSSVSRSTSRWLYLCMKFTKVTNDLYFFYLLSDIFTDSMPNERVFMSGQTNLSNDEETMCSTFCQYTDSPKIRTLRRQGTSDSLPNSPPLCDCGSSCSNSRAYSIGNSFGHNSRLEMLPIYRHIGLDLFG
ncbi:unnamed protein product [Mytilus coruscus]|uniref:Uncharacterized protein n=1 Tax=Mytilus coruscus TaxID=42192 RepID=A0A6J8AWG2_MYTCO|nr:unnamed protein product [Mytilus coruscus]